MSYISLKTRIKNNVTVPMLNSLVVMKREDGLEDSSVSNKLQGFVSKVIEDFRKTVHFEWKKAIKSYTQDKTDRQRDLVDLGLEYNANLYKPYIKTLIDRIYNRLYDTQIDFVVEAQKKKYKKGEKSIKALFENAFINPANRMEFFTSVKHMVVGGNGFGKAVLQINEHNEPELKFKHVPLFNLYFNVNTDFYAGGFPVIERSIMPMSEAVKEISEYIELGDDEIEYILRHAKPFSGYDDNRVWDIWTKQDILQQTYNNAITNAQYFGDNVVYQIDNFDNDLSELVYVWTNDTLIIAINGIVVLDTKNPLGMHPYINLMFDTSLGRQISRGIAIVHNDEQLEINAIHNAMLDQARRSCIQMYIKRGAGIIEGAEGGTFEPENGKVLTIQGDASLDEFNPFKIDPNLMNIADYINAQGENAAGINGYTGGNKEGIERSSFASQALVNVTIQTLKPAVEGISMGLTRMAYVWQRQMLSRLNGAGKDIESLEIKVFDGEYEKVKLNLLDGDYNIVFSNKALVTLENNQKVLDNINALNQLSPYMKDPTTGRPYINTELLTKQILGQLGYDDGIYETEDEFFQKTMEYEIKKIDMQKQLLQKQQELQQMQQQGQPQPTNNTPPPANSNQVDLGNL